MEVHKGIGYILDNLRSKAVLAFSDKGTFIAKTKPGRGPGELIDPYALYLDKLSDRVYVWDQRGAAMHQFNARLEHLGQEKFAIPLSAFLLLENNRTLIHTHYYQDSVFKVIGADHETVEQSFIPDLSYPWGTGIFRSISTHKRTLLITPYNYHIYQLADGEINPLYYLDFGSYKLTPDDIENKDIGGVIALQKQGERVSSLNDISEGDSFLSFRVYFKSEELNYAYAFGEDKVFLLNEYIDKGLLPFAVCEG